MASAESVPKPSLVNDGVPKLLEDDGVPSKPPLLDDDDRPPARLALALGVSVAGLITFLICAALSLVIRQPSHVGVKMLVLPTSELLPAPKNLTSDRVAFTNQWAGYYQPFTPVDDVHVLVVESSVAAPAEERPSNAVVRPSSAMMKAVSVTSSAGAGEINPLPLLLSSPSPPPLSTAPASPSPPPPPPTPPSPSHPPPWWVVEARRPARPKHASSPASVPAPSATGKWAYEVLDPRPGTVLLSAGKTSAPAGQPYLADAAILLVHVCGCHPAVFGVLLSAPTNTTMAEHFCPITRARYPSFVNSTMHLGGPVGPHWTVLHSFPTAGSVEVRPGLHAGGCLSDAQAKVSARPSLAAQVHFFSGYLAFPLESLEAELSAGKWRVAAVSSELIQSQLEADGGAGMRESILAAMD